MDIMDAIRERFLETERNMIETEIAAGEAAQMALKEAMEKEFAWEDNDNG